MVRLPGPQPRSTTTDGSSASTRPTRSAKGRPRSPAYLPYCWGFHTGEVRILPPSLQGLLTSRYFTLSTCLDVKSLDGYSRTMKDEVDRLIEAWRRERPDLD